MAEVSVQPNEKNKARDEKFLFRLAQRHPFAEEDIAGRMNADE